ncbi:hypothetical protein BN1723_011669, partial [Verticillium longisporum]
MAPRQIALSLYHRDRFSQGRMRRVFGYEAYHWAIIVMPEQSQGRDCWTFEATDASEIDPVTFRMNNSTMDWWLRDKPNVDPELSSKLVGIVLLGQTPDGLSFPEMPGVMTGVPLPVKNMNPQQSCVTWAENAIRTLQSRGWIWGFDMNQFKDWAVGYADERMKMDSSQPKFIQYG